jgi:hypothetical protein
MAGKKNQHHRKQARRDQAETLKKDRALRTDQQQLIHLDKLLGKGKGAKKERARLKKQIEKQKKQPKEKKNANA